MKILIADDDKVHRDKLKKFFLNLVMYMTQTMANQPFLYLNTT